MSYFEWNIEKLTKIKAIKYPHITTIKRSSHNFRVLGKIKVLPLHSANENCPADFVDYSILLDFLLRFTETHQREAAFDG